jgi:hypothetical protein
MLSAWIPQSEVVVLAAVCAAAASIILSRFTLNIGTITYIINFCSLFAGALTANVVVRQFYAPLDDSMQRPLIISLFGMLIVALATLAFLGRGKYSN